MNVYDQAHQLAQAIRESEEYKRYEKSKADMEANPQLNDAMKDFMKKQFEVQAQQMMGEEISEETVGQMQQLSAILMQDPTAAEYLQNQMRFSMMMSDVYKIVGEVADFGLDDMTGM
ncbi:MAG: YlbF family regulator [Firmicutes bacterium]|nr:YlbF family regulator [Bacillota bacterium]